MQHGKMRTVEGRPFQMNSLPPSTGRVKPYSNSICSSYVNVFVIPLRKVSILYKHTIQQQVSLEVISQGPSLSLFPAPPQITR